MLDLYTTYFIRLYILGHVTIYLVKGVISRKSYRSIQDLDNFKFTFLKLQTIFKIMVIIRNVSPVTENSNILMWQTFLRCSHYVFHEAAFLPGKGQSSNFLLSTILSLSMYGSSELAELKDKEHWGRIKFWKVHSSSSKM